MKKTNFNSWIKNNPWKSIISLILTTSSITFSLTYFFIIENQYIKKEKVSNDFILRNKHNEYVNDLKYKHSLQVENYKKTLDSCFLKKRGEISKNNIQAKNNNNIENQNGTITINQD